MDRGAWWGPWDSKELDTTKQLTHTHTHTHTHTLVDKVSYPQACCLLGQPLTGETLKLMEDSFFLLISSSFS